MSSRHDDELPAELQDIAARLSASRPSADADTLHRVQRRIAPAPHSSSPARTSYRMGRKRFALSLAILVAMVASTGAGVAATDRGVKFTSLPVVSILKSRADDSSAANIPAQRFQRRLKRGEAQVDAPTSVFTRAATPRRCSLLAFIRAPGGLHLIIGIRINAGCLQYFLSTPFVFTP